MRSGNRVLAAALSLGVAVLASACSSASGAAPSGSSAGAAIVAVGAENEYANVIAQVGGKYVQASAIMSNPSTDPHTFEASPSVRLLREARSLGDRFPDAEEKVAGLVALVDEALFH